MFGSSKQRIIISVVVALSLGVIVPGAVFAGQKHLAAVNRIGSHYLRSAQDMPVVSFGGQPVIPMKPFTITIDGSGKVQGSSARTALKAAVTLDLRALLKLAEAEGFFSMPDTITGTRMNVDNGPRFITIYTTNGPKTVSLNPTGESSQFNQLYG